MKNVFFSMGKYDFFYMFIVIREVSHGSFGTFPGTLGVQKSLTGDEKPPESTESTQLEPVWLLEPDEKSWKS